MEKKYKLHLKYDELEIIEADVTYNRESGEWNDKTDEELFNMACQDNNIFYNEWEYIKDTLTDHLSNKSGYFLAYSKSMGRDNRSGYKYFYADNGKDFLDEILPDCDLTMELKSYYNGYKIRVSHHDRPTGETYIVKPVSEKEYEKNQ